VLLYIRVYLYFIQHNIYWLIVHKIITVYIANTEGTPGIEIEPNFLDAGYNTSNKRLFVLRDEKWTIASCSENVKLFARKRKTIPSNKQFVRIGDWSLSACYMATFVQLCLPSTLLRVTINTIDYNMWF
jgi:hypothetical protein